MVLDREYLIEIIGAYTVNGTIFPDCIRVTVDNSQDSDEFLRGSGYLFWQKISVLFRWSSIVMMVPPPVRISGGGTPNLIQDVRNVVFPTVVGL